MPGASAIDCQHRAHRESALNLVRSSAKRQRVRLIRSVGLMPSARLIIGLALALQVTPALAATPFEERVKRARTAEESPALKPYFSAMGKAIEPNLRSGVATCLAKFKDPDMNGFIVVADVNKNGEPTNVDWQPHTNVSDCFARSFEFARLPKLAPYTKDPLLPIFFQINVK